MKTKILIAICIIASVAIIPSSCGGKGNDQTKEKGKSDDQTKVDSLNNEKSDSASAKSASANKSTRNADIKEEATLVLAAPCPYNPARILDPDPKYCDYRTYGDCNSQAAINDAIDCHHIELCDIQSIIVPSTNQWGGYSKWWRCDSVYNMIKELRCDQNDLIKIEGDDKEKEIKFKVVDNNKIAPNVDGGLGINFLKGLFLRKMIAVTNYQNFRFVVYRANKTVTDQTTRQYKTLPTFAFKILKISNGDAYYYGDMTEVLPVKVLLKK